MESEMTHWNDDRLDELNERVKEGFAEVDERFVRLEGEMKQGFERVDERFAGVATKEELSGVRVELRRLNERFDRFLFILVGTCFSLIGSLLIAVLAFFLQS